MLGNITKKEPALQSIPDNQKKKSWREYLNSFLSLSQVTEIFKKSHKANAVWLAKKRKSSVLNQSVQTPPSIFHFTTNGLCFEVVRACLVSKQVTNQSSDQRSCVRALGNPGWVLTNQLHYPHTSFHMGSSLQVARHFIGKRLHLQHIIYCSLPASASHGLWQQPLQIALLGELGTHSGSKDGLTLCQKNTNQITSVLSPSPSRLSPLLRDEAGIQDGGRQRWLIEIKLRGASEQSGVPRSHSEH